MNATTRVSVRPADAFPLTAPSLTDLILTLCASGHFGVREAIAAATRQAPGWIDPHPAEAATTRPLPVAPRRTTERARLAPPAR